MSETYGIRPIDLQAALEPGPAMSVDLFRPTEPGVKPASPVEQALSMIERAARDPSVDVVKLQALQDLQFRLLDRQAVEDWHEAVASLPPMRVKKNGTIDLGKGKGSIPFARWEDCDAVLRPLLDAVGLFLTFDSAPRPGEAGGLIVTGSLRHRRGHSMSASIPLPMDAGPGRGNLQAYGSSLSYGKRYTAEMLLNIVREGDDDDGVRGGLKLISLAQADELRQLCHDAQRIEGQILHQMFGDNYHSFDELEQGAGFMAVRNTLAMIVQRAKEKG